jgi:hypothetical protein
VFTSIAEVVEFLHNGEITAQLLDFLLKHREPFFKVAAIADQECNDKLLDIRQRELETFRTKSGRLQKLFLYCQVYIKAGIGIFRGGNVFMNARRIFHQI